MICLEYTVRNSTPDNLYLKAYTKMKRLFILISISFIVMTSFAAPLLPVNMKLLMQLRDKYKNGNIEAVKTVELYKINVQKFIQAEAPSVTKKKVLPPTNDKRDYVSLSRYWWPDSTKKDGLPYIRHDGKVNPEIRLYPDFDNSNKLDEAVKALSMLYYITGEEIYAENAARYLRTWFTDRKTGMNPNMVFSQFIPGRTSLRGTGLLDGRHMARAVCFSQLLDGSASWTSADKKALMKWTKAYCYWYENSTQGQKEHQANNNHGIWYDLTHMLLHAYLGETDSVKSIICNDLMLKLDTQIAKDGSLPQELSRTLSLHYSTFVMEALTEISYVARLVDINIWAMHTTSGTSASKCLEFLFPYYIKPLTWPYQQISPFDVNRTAVILYEAGLALDNKSYMSRAFQIGIASKDRKSDLLPYYILRK